MALVSKFRSSGWIHYGLSNENALNLRLGDTIDLLQDNPEKYFKEIHFWIQIFTESKDVIYEKN